MFKHPNIQILNILQHWPKTDFKFIFCSNLLGKQQNKLLYISSVDVNKNIQKILCTYIMHSISDFCHGICLDMMKHTHWLEDQGGGAPCFGPHNDTCASSHSPIQHRIFVFISRCETADTPQCQRHVSTAGKWMRSMGENCIQKQLQGNDTHARTHTHTHTPTHAYTHTGRQAGRQAHTHTHTHTACNLQRWLQPWHNTPLPPAESTRAVVDCVGALPCNSTINFMPGLWTATEGRRLLRWDKYQQLSIAPPPAPNHPHSPWQLTQIPRLILS